MLRKLISAAVATSLAQNPSTALRTVSNLRAIADNSVDIPLEVQTTIGYFVRNITDWLPRVAEITERSTLFTITDYITNAATHLMQVVLCFTIFLMKPTATTF